MHAYKITLGQAVALRQPKDEQSPTNEENADVASGITVMVDARSAKEALESLSHALTTLVNTQRGGR